MDPNNGLHDKIYRFEKFNGFYNYKRLYLLKYTYDF
mgnify:FL=1